MVPFHIDFVHVGFHYGELNIEDIMAFITEQKRTHYCTDLNISNKGEEVVLMGWIETRRDLGSMIFVDLRDRTGIAQVVFDPKLEGLADSKDLRNEFVVALSGIVNPRPEGMTNKSMKTGEIEIIVNKFEILSKAQTPPFKISDEKVGENLRLKYRYLDLRSKRLQDNLKLRHKVTSSVRNYLDAQGFLDVETPILYKSTPEGARDYLVPSRISEGEFYALPQSPQTLKQLLMIAGYDKYYQIARCFRDEDLRADRQPEFSQIDIEMSFVDQSDIQKMTEGLVKTLWKEFRGIEDVPIASMTYHEAMERFGCDKPDLRVDIELVDLANVVKGSGFKVFDDALAADGAVKAIAVSGCGEYSRGKLDKLTTLAKHHGAKGLVWIKSNKDSGELTSSVSKFFNAEKLEEIFNTVGAKKGDGVFIVADEYAKTCATLSALRLHLAKELNLLNASEDRFLWVTDFPLLDYDEDEDRWIAMHHPFTAPSDGDMDKMLSGSFNDIRKLKAKAYDLVCNGHEIAGGSVRIHRDEVQQAMFNLLGMSAEEIKSRFGFFIEALQYGTPPHGGIAWGLDRLIMILASTDAIRDVIAFPKTTKATDLMASAPSPVDTKQLDELHITLKS
jgi:aspartyl-tRNA synthetase